MPVMTSLKFSFIWLKCMYDCMMYTHITNSTFLIEWGLFVAEFERYLCFFRLVIIELMSCCLVVKIFKFRCHTFCVFIFTKRFFSA